VIPTVDGDNLRSNAQFARDPSDAELERFLKPFSVYALDDRSRVRGGLSGDHGW
jgi:hypothetical protein